MNVLVTGCNGFIGHNFLKIFTEKFKDAKVVNIDCNTYAAVNIFEHKNYIHYKGDIRNKHDIDIACCEFDGKVNYIVNFAAESHVDNSIKNPNVFVETNVLGTMNLLNLAKRMECRYMQISTDEVYGSLGDKGFFTELSPIDPHSPYSASKASADHLVKAWHDTYGLDTVITRCSNNYGPSQLKDKLIPLVITNLLQDIPIPLYGNGMNVRDWIHVNDHCEAIITVLMNAKSGSIYNVGSRNERTNFEIITKLIKIIEPKTYSIKKVADRLGHDFRYAIDPTKIETELGWTPQINFDDGLKETVEWYINNEAWWKRKIK